jgi:hypothetical protein
MKFIHSFIRSINKYMNEKKLYLTGNVQGYNRLNCQPEEKNSMECALISAVYGSVRYSCIFEISAMQDGRI